MIIITQKKLLKNSLFSTERKVEWQKNLIFHSSQLCCISTQKEQMMEYNHQILEAFLHNKQWSLAWCNYLVNFVSKQDLSWWLLEYKSSFSLKNTNQSIFHWKFLRNLKISTLTSFIFVPLATAHWLMHKMCEKNCQCKENCTSLWHFFFSKSKWFLRKILRY